MKNKISIITLGSALVTGILFNHLFYGKVPGISFAIFFYFTLACIVVFARFSKCSFNPPQILMMGGVLIFSFFFCYRAAPELVLINFCLTIYFFTLVFSNHLTGRSIKGQNFIDYFFLPFRFFIRSYSYGGKEVLNKCRVRNETHLSIAKRFLIGLLIAIPLLLLISLLMSSADQIFKKLADSFWEFFREYLLEGIGRGILILIVTVLYAGIYSWKYRKGEEDVKRFVTTPSKQRGFVEGTVIITLLNVLFLIFTGIQVIFLLGKEEQITRLGVTYSVYARQGFWQMVCIAIIVLIISILLEGKMGRNTDKQRRIHKINLCLTSLMMTVVMISAFYRLWLYEQSYGFTVLRFYSHTFIIYVAAVFVILSTKILKEHSSQKFLFNSFVATLLLFVFWNVSNPHYFIASINLNRHKTSVRELDISYLNQLSDDAIPAITSALNEERDDPAYEKLREHLIKRRVKIQKRIENKTLLSQNIATLKALTEIDRILK
ncbi:MAG: DUF4173 domain-containing protein [Candidatus Omnitrophica bacterium]|nr:DUF4173 domain-containing protein [Candidatus Omnitrophota bacterium]